MSLLARFRLEQAICPGSPSHPNRQGHGPRSPPGSPNNRLEFPRSPNSPIRSPTPPEFPPAQHRRARTDSLEALEEEREIKRKKLFARDICRQNHLEEDALEEFAGLTLDEMVIALFGKQMAVERGRQQDEAHAFIRSAQLKDILKDRLRTCLLSPNLSKYHDSLPENIWVFIKNNLTVFKIPSAALEDPELNEHVDGLIKDILTKQRSQIKIKLAASITKRFHISQLARSLCCKDFTDVTLPQWARFAFLRQGLIMFNKMVAESLKKKVNSLEQDDVEPTGDDAEPTGDDDAPPDNSQGNEASEGPDNGEATAKEDTQLWEDSQYWNFIDKLLDELREDITTRPAIRQKGAWEQHFTNTLMTDFELFPPSSKNAGVRPSDGKSMSEWQRAVHEHLVWM